jgi:L-histidine N-alpha-methyltransferase
VLEAATQPARRGRPFDEQRRVALEVRRSLTAPLPWLPSRFFYDERGSRLFDEITRLPEYYLTRTETAILEREAPGLAARVLAEELVELGSGFSDKVRLLIQAFRRGGRLRRVTLLDVSEEALRDSLDRIEREFPELEACAVVGDFLDDLAGGLGPGGGRLLAFLGSTIGNVHPREVPGFLVRVRACLEPGDRLLLGVDLVKDPSRLEAAYNDRAGVTAEFNRNILRVVNAQVGTDFDPAGFDHRAFYDAERSWIEMRLRCRRPMAVHLASADLRLLFARGDEIRTEISCKYTRASLETLTRGTGLSVVEWHTDPEGLFAVALLKPDPVHRRP